MRALWFHRSQARFSTFFFILGPCVIESEELAFTVASAVKETATRLGIPVIFKSSYDKANRTSIASFRGPGLDEGLKVLSGVKSRFDLPVISDVHSVEEAKTAAEVLDVILREGLEHHVSLTYGDYVPALLTLAEILELPVLRL